MNDGPLCRCSLKSKEAGIRHDIYPGETVSFSNIIDIKVYKSVIYIICIFLLVHLTPSTR